MRKAIGTSIRSANVESLKLERFQQQDGTEDFTDDNDII